MLQACSDRLLLNSADSPRLPRYLELSKSPGVIPKDPGDALAARDAAGIPFLHDPLH
jgi:hypothetical protein